MKKVILICSIILASCSGSQKDFMNDFVFKSSEELTEVYGEPQTAYLKNGAEWILENNIQVTVFYKSNDLQEAEIIRFKNIEIDEDLFYNDFGWELPLLSVDEVSQKTTANNLKGIKEAVYNKRIKLLSIILDNPKLDTFGDKIR